MRLFNFHSINLYKTFSKTIIGCIFIGGGSYLLNKNKTSIYLHTPQKSIISAVAATNRLDQIKSFNFIADVVETITPSVVSITVGGGILGSSFGSGFIVDDSGYILTNAHVVLRNPFVSVTLSDGQKFQGEVVAIDRSSDLALIKINSGRTKLQTLKFAEISELRAGEFVIALGSPMTLSNSVTVGVVSAVQRDLGHAKGLKYVQTDAIITVGNSGGPLVNLYGDVVGINTMMVSTGFGFAIPSNHCKNFVTRAMSATRSGGSFSSSVENRRSTKSDSSNKYMGVVMGSLTPEMAIENRMINPEHSVHPTSGVIVHSVFYQSPAHKSGILPGDIIVSVNGVMVHSTGELTSLISKYDELDIALIRKGKRFILNNVIPETI